jgi:exosome complex RNA-binding protein Rrp4
VVVHRIRRRENVSNRDKEKQALEIAKVYETGEIITTKVYKVSPEQKEELNHLSTERLEKLREEAIPNIRERYEQIVKLRQQQSKADEGSKPPGDSAR